MGSGKAQLFPGVFLSLEENKGCITSFAAVTNSSGKITTLFLYEVMCRRWGLAAAVVCMFSHSGPRLKTRLLTVTCHCCATYQVLGWAVWGQEGDQDIVADIELYLP